MAAKCSFLSLCKLKNFELHIKNQNDDHNTHFKIEIGIYYLKSTSYILHNFTISSFIAPNHPMLLLSPFNCKKCPKKQIKTHLCYIFISKKQGFFPPQKSNFKPAATIILTNPHIYSTQYTVLSRNSLFWGS